MPGRNRLNILNITLMGAVLAFGAAEAACAQPTFNFRAVEFMPLEQREPAARAFLADKVQAGTPMAEAIRTLRVAGAHCGAPRPDGTVPCISSSVERDLGGDLADITWRVRLTPDERGAVAGAVLTRTRAGL